MWGAEESVCLYVCGIVHLMSELAFYPRITSDRGVLLIFIEVARDELYLHWFGRRRIDGGCIFLLVFCLG